MWTTRRSGGTRRVKNAASVSASRSTTCTEKPDFLSYLITSTTVADYKQEARAAICAAVEGVYNNKLRLLYNVDVTEDRKDNKNKPATFDQQQKAYETAKGMATKVASLKNVFISLARVGASKTEDGEYLRSAKKDKAFVKTLNLVHQMMITCILLQATTSTNTTNADTNSTVAQAQKAHESLVQAVHCAGYTKHAQDLARPCQFDAFVKATSLVYEQPWGSGDHFDDDRAGSRAQLQLFTTMLNKIVRSCLVVPKDGSARQSAEQLMESYDFHAQITAFKINPEAGQRITAAMQKRLAGMEKCPSQRGSKSAEREDGKNENKSSVVIGTGGSRRIFFY